MRLILASTSPRRRELLQQLGVAFTCEAPHVDESAYTHLPPREQAETLAVLKARDVATRFPTAHVLGGDTLVVVNGVVFGKPLDTSDAARMLQQLQGRTHDVVTAIALVRLHPSFERTHLEISRVTMCALTAAEIADYVATGEPLDKAGAYGVQGLGGALITQVEGNYHAVVGLPLEPTRRLLQAAGLSV